MPTRTFIKIFGITIVLLLLPFVSSLLNDQIDWDILDYSVMGSMIFTAISLFFLYQQKIQKNQIELLDRDLHPGDFPIAMGGVGGGNLQHPFRGKLIIKPNPPQGELCLVFEIAEPFFGINR